MILSFFLLLFTLTLGCMAQTSPPSEDTKAPNVMEQPTADIQARDTARVLPTNRRPVCLDKNEIYDAASGTCIKAAPANLMNRRWTNNNNNRNRFWWNNNNRYWRNNNNRYWRNNNNVFWRPNRIWGRSDSTDKGDGTRLYNHVNCPSGQRWVSNLRACRPNNFQGGLPHRNCNSGLKWSSNADGCYYINTQNAKSCGQNQFFRSGVGCVQKGTGVGWNRNYGYRSNGNNWNNRNRNY